MTHPTDSDDAWSSHPVDSTIPANTAIPADRIDAMIDTIATAEDLAQAEKNNFEKNGFEKNGFDGIVCCDRYPFCQCPDDGGGSLAHPAASGTCGYWPTGLDPAVNSSSTAVDTRPNDAALMLRDALKHATMAYEDTSDAADILKGSSPGAAKDLNRLAGILQSAAHVIDWIITQETGR